MDEVLANYEKLKNDYLILLNSFFTTLPCSCACTPESAQSRVIDIYTMGLSLAGMLIDQSKYNEAQRILNLMSSCNSTISSTCGCNE